MPVLLTGDRPVHTALLLLGFAALVGTGLLSVLILPMTAMRLRSQRAPTRSV